MGPQRIEPETSHTLNENHTTRSKTLNEYASLFSHIMLLSLPFDSKELPSFQYFILASNFSFFFLSKQLTFCYLSFTRNLNFKNKEKIN